MTEIQEVGETTRPARAELLKGFEQAYLTTSPSSLEEVAKDGCHTASTSAGFPNGFRFVKLTRPTAPPFANVDYAGQ